MRWLRSSRLKVHKVAQQLRPVSTNSPPSSSLHNPTRIYTRAVTDAADASSPSASIISIPPRPICHCNSQSDTTRDMEILTSILQMGLLLVGRQVDQQHVQALVSNVLAVSKVLSTPNGNQTSSTSSVNPSTLVGPGLPAASLHRPASPLGIDGTSEPTPDQPPTPDYSQRKRFRRSSSGSEGELMPRVQAHIPDDQPLLTEFPLPRPTTANIYPSTDGSPPVIRIPECTDNSMDSFADQSASPTSSELTTRASAKLKIDHIFAIVNNSSSILCGDFNAHNPLWNNLTTNSVAKTCSTGNYLRTLLQEFSDVSLVNSSDTTHLCGGVLDLTFVSSPLLPLTKWSLHPFLASDHFAVTTTIQALRVPTPSPTLKCNLQRADWRLYKDLIEDWVAGWVPPDD
ncbi:putative RNA-directed DNA polymerase from mobile element jockey-like [Penaeus vannamei]|uniref:Putative RNA-directed DNA polymerase from mobile element jockey-like n=1 Tax=Penaeus vannamei TaxID=6689 RepID=A0A423T516_PENVA|nr:putative RNA-directed DNA polymerase from mobile element jockey-like [Penaeus vannamei]